MLNYYEILQVSHAASSEEIKQSFRSLAKKYHPDKNSCNQRWAEEKIKLVIKAYKTLIDSALRKDYDTLLRKIFESNNNKDNKKRPHTSSEKGAGDVCSQVKTILWDLLNENGGRAVENFENLKGHLDNFGLDKFLTQRDYLDCIFLLAEEYERLGKFGVALEFYENVYEIGKNNAAVCSFFLVDEARERIKRIYCKRLVKAVSTEEAIMCYQNALKLDLDIDNNERAFIYKKVAECYFKLGEYNNAMANLELALSLKPTLKGISRIQTKLNQHYGIK